MDISIMNVPITIEKPKFIPDCFALVIRYIPRAMDYEYVKEKNIQVNRISCYSKEDSILI